MTDQQTNNPHEIPAHSRGPLAALDHWRDLSAKIAANPAHITQAFDDAQNALAWLWQNAEESGNEQAKGEIITTWSRFQQIRDLALGYDAVLAAGQAAVETIDGQRLEAIDELASLLEAIDQGDSYDPRLQDFAESIADDTEMYVQEYMYDQLADVASEEYFDTVYATLSAQGFNHNDSTRLMDLLEGNVNLNDEQCEQLKALLDSLKGDEA